MSSIAQLPRPRKVAIGVDTHKYIHVAVALDELGGRLGELTVSADSDGYARLERWAVEQGAVLASGSRAQRHTGPASRATSAGTATG